jgi:hypothetical protein
MEMARAGFGLQLAGLSGGEEEEIMVSPHVCQPEGMYCGYNVVPWNS